MKFNLQEPVIDNRFDEHDGKLNRENILTGMQKPRSDKPEIGISHERRQKPNKYNLPNGKFFGFPLEKKPNNQNQGRYFNCLRKNETFQETPIKSGGKND